MSKHASFYVLIILVILLAACGSKETKIEAPILGKWCADSPLERSCYGGVMRNLASAEFRSNGSVYQVYCELGGSVSYTLPDDSHVRIHAIPPENDDPNWEHPPLYDAVFEFQIEGGMLTLTRQDGPDVMGTTTLTLLACSGSNNFGLTDG